MRTPVALALAAALVLSALALPVAAHGNHLSADPQVSTDGTLVVEAVLPAVDAWVVVRADDGGSPGEPLGHAPVDPDDGFRTDLRVAVEPDAWANWTGTRTVWTVLHGDDGDGEFDPDEDEMLTGVGEPAGDRIAVRRGDAPAYVTAERFAPQQSDDGTVVVRAAALHRDGYVVVRNATGDGSGAVVGATALPAGVNENVTVDLDRSFYRAQDEQFALWAGVSVDDGDGEFDGDDTPVRVGDRAAATTFGVERTGEHSPTPAEDAGDGDHEDGHHHGGNATAHEHGAHEGTATDHHDGNATAHEHDHATPTATAAGEGADSPIAPAGTSTPGGGPGTAEGGPGFGPAVATAVALAVGLVLASVRRG